jgi:hypothetical protein
VRSSGLSLSTTIRAARINSMKALSRQDSAVTSENHRPVVEAKLLAQHRLGGARIELVDIERSLDQSELLRAMCKLQGGLTRDAYDRADVLAGSQPSGAGADRRRHGRIEHVPDRRGAGECRDRAAEKPGRSPVAEYQIEALFRMRRSSLTRPAVARTTFPAARSILSARGASKSFRSIGCDKGS